LAANRFRLAEAKDVHLVVKTKHIRLTVDANVNKAPVNGKTTVKNFPYKNLNASFSSLLPLAGFAAPHQSPLVVPTALRLFRLIVNKLKMADVLLADIVTEEFMLTWTSTSSPRSAPTNPTNSTNLTNRKYQPHKHSPANSSRVPASINPSVQWELLLFLRVASVKTRQTETEFAKWKTLAQPALTLVPKLNTWTVEIASKAPHHPPVFR
jgi:hypothetical protein